MNSNVLTSIREITPEQAQYWLDNKRGNNRHINSGAVDVLAKAMKVGKFTLNGQALIFNHRGLLIDGQHRLTACVEAQKSFETVVVEGVGDDSFTTIDVGKKRDLNDILEIEGFMNGQRKVMGALAPTLRLVYLHKYYGEPAPNVNGAAASVTNQIALEFMQENDHRARLLQDAAVFASNSKKPNTFWNGRVIGYMYYMAYTVDPIIAKDFFTNLGGVLDGRSENPAQALLHKISKNNNAKNRLSYRVGLALSIKAWNAFRDHKPLTKLDFKVGKKNKEEFPTFNGLDVSKI